MRPSCSTEAGTEAAPEIPTRFEKLLPNLLTQSLAAQDLSTEESQVQGEQLDETAARRGAEGWQKHNMDTWQGSI